jgi:hypothetical protein
MFETETKPNHKKNNKMKLLKRIEKSVNERLLNVLDELDSVIQQLKTKKTEP